MQYQTSRRGGIQEIDGDTARAMLADGARLRANGVGIVIASPSAAYYGTPPESPAPAPALAEDQAHASDA